MSIPNNVHELLNDRQAAKVLTTVGKDGQPHSVVVGSIMSTGEMLCAAEVLMKKTSENLETNQKVAILTVKSMESYLVEATAVERQTEGELYNMVKAELDKMGMTMRGLWIFKPTAIYNQSASPESGTKIC